MILAHLNTIQVQTNYDAITYFRWNIKYDFYKPNNKLSRLYFLPLKLPSRTKWYTYVKDEKQKN